MPCSSWSPRDRHDQATCATIHMPPAMGLASIHTTAWVHRGYCAPVWCLPSSQGFTSQKRALVSGLKMTFSFAKRPRYSAPAYRQNGKNRYTRANETTIFAFIIRWVLNSLGLWIAIAYLWCQAIASGTQPDMSVRCFAVGLSSQSLMQF